MHGLQRDKRARVSDGSVCFGHRLKQGVRLYEILLVGIDGFRLAGIFAERAVRVDIFIVGSDDFRGEIRLAEVDFLLEQLVLVHNARL